MFTVKRTLETANLPKQYQQMLHSQTFVAGVQTEYRETEIGFI